ncbi:MAG: ergothioneine biosynthesis protein EgtB [Curvibacter sp.]|nr:ergothioneine biosynthesis protein EgtB [Curvibacter sp.]
MAYELPVPSYSRLDSADLRRAGRDMLSLALMDARNHTLFVMGECQKAMEACGVNFPCLPELNPPLWELGHIGWFQERWIGRNLQRHQGPRADPQAVALASVQPQADFWWDDTRLSHDGRRSLSLPPLADIKAYLLATLESTLDMLARTPDEDDALYFYRLALFHEDLHGEALIAMAQTLGLRLRLPLPAPGLIREPLWLPATRWRLGLDAGAGFSFDNERPAHEVAVPEFEIDAQPVSWTQYVEFVADGGYDRPELWQPAGWDWLRQQSQGDEGRRAPRHVEQIGVARAGGQGGVLQRWFGRTVRVAGWSPVMHVSWWEADAWCRWAGRRLPTEVEWEQAAHQAAARGFRWGDVWEWTGSSFHGYPGFQAGPWRDYSESGFGSHKVLRGASLATRRRMKSAKFRHFLLPGRDDAFCGFRSCAF